MADHPETGDLYGIVTDREDEPLPGVRITLISEGRPAGTTVSNAGGRFRFVHLAPGSYDLEAELEADEEALLPGQQPPEVTMVEAIEVKAGRRARVEIDLHARVR